MQRFRIVITVFYVIGFGAWLTAVPAVAQDLHTKAEAEGKLMFYATFNAADSKMLADGFRQAYAKIDATFYRTTDAALMERILTESRAGQNLWDVAVTTSFYGHNLKKRGLFAIYDSLERKYFREGYKDAQGAWTSVYTNYAAFGYNTSAVPKTAVPKSHADLLKSEWKGQVGIDSKAYEWFGTMLKGMGEEKGLADMRELAQADAVACRSYTAGPASRRVSLKAHCRLTRRLSKC